MTAAITDFSQFTALRKGAARNDPATLKTVAGQFEALFIESMLKNMRASSLGDPLFGKSDQYEMYQGLLDKQLSVEMASGQGIGLARMLVEQLGGSEQTAGPGGSGQTAGPGGSGQTAGPGGGWQTAGPGGPGPAPADFRLPASHRFRASYTATATAKAPSWTSPLDFAKAVWPHVKRAARALNVPAEAILAQAALETGWGEHVPQRADGASSLNLFGIKSGPGWQGESAHRSTVEYADGVAHREPARFRTYPDLGAAFDDYVELLNHHPRYANVKDKGGDTYGFARALQAAGYATDPAYADKIGNILRGETMQKALTMLRDHVTLPIPFKITVKR